MAPKTMEPIARALWFIETRFKHDLSLEAVANHCGLSRFYLTRAFCAVTGQSVMRYIRSRRLTEAAHVLVNSSDDILSIALAVGYGSHEAFTRAFRGEFGCTPESVRQNKNSLSDLALTESYRLESDFKIPIDPPRIIEKKTFCVAGIGGPYSLTTDHGIPALWQEFVPYIGHVQGQVGTATYGVCNNYDGSGNFDYIAGVEVSDTKGLPKELQVLPIPTKTYAVFTHGDHVSTIRNTIYSIWGSWLPQSPFKTANSPDFEIYGDKFNGLTGEGEFEIWIPILPAS